MRPLLILAEGQSNCMARMPYNWTPPCNLFIWDFDGQVDPSTKVGTCFHRASDYSNVMNCSFSFASEFAEENPDREIYLVCVAIGGLPISKWLPGTPTPDMYAATKANIEAALDHICDEPELIHFWWQGEGDAGVNQNYPGDFWAHIARKMMETWWPITTPTVVMGMSPFCNDTIKQFNRKLVEAASVDANRRVFVDTSIIPQFLWEPVGGPYVHMTGPGYKAAGRLAYQALRYGTKSGISRGSFSNPATGHQIRNVPAFRYMRQGGAGPGIMTAWNIPSGINNENCFVPVNGGFIAPDDGLYMLGFNAGNTATDAPLTMCLTKNEVEITGTYVTALSAYESVSLTTLLYLKRNEYAQVKITQGNIWTSPAGVCFWGYFVG